MTETPDPATEAVTTVTPGAGHAAVVAAKPNRLYQAAAWVAIVAGTVFVVGAVFCTGFLLGRNSEGPGHFGHHRHGGPMMMHPGGPMGHPGGPMGPMGHPGGPMGPMGQPGGPMGPMMAPGGGDQDGSPGVPRSVAPGVPAPPPQSTPPHR